MVFQEKQRRYTLKRLVVSKFVGEDHLKIAKESLQILLIFIFVVILPIIWLPCYLYRLIVIVIAKSFPSYFGKIFTFREAFLDEDFTSLGCRPISNIVTTMLIEGTVSISSLRQQFDKTVIEAKLGNDLRYPELQQYPVSFLGHRFWKWDSKFNIEHHIKEEYSSVFSSKNNNFELGLIHQELLNRSFSPETSPWELILIPNPNGGTQSQSLLALRLHHTMADAKSILKILVECLGGKALKTATSPPIQLTSWEKIVSSVLLLFNSISYVAQLGKCAISSHFHPWKVRRFSGEDSRLVVGLSKKLPLDKIKKISKRNGVTASSFLLSMITRAIKKSFPNNVSENDLGVGYVFPKPEHPPHLTNHVYMGMLPLPLRETDQKRNLQECHERFTQLKRSELFKVTDFPTFQLGTLPNPLRGIVARNFFGVSGITNIAGEEQGFSLGNGLVCSEMTMSVGTLPGGAGLIFCVFSYRQCIRIAVIANESIIKGEQANVLAQQVGNELDKFE